jgi:glycosyltransferase involved in cell wall biosynthesis
MIFCFITTQYLSSHASMKRSVGMAPLLAAAGHSVTVLLLEHPENRRLSLVHEQVTWVFFPALSMIGERRWKYQFLAKNHFDVIIYNALGWRNAVRAPGYNRPKIAFMEHCELESANRSLSYYRRIAMYALEWWSIWAFDGQLGASRYLVDLLKRRCFLMKWRRAVIWSPYAVENPAVAAPQSVRRGSEPKLILHVGTVATNYGADFMLKGLHKLRKGRVDWRAVFVGQGPALTACRQQVQNLCLGDHIHFPGYLSEHELRGLLAQASVFLSHLNDTEQDWARCPSKLYYYMTYRRPVVTTAIGENRIALGESGFYYNSENIDDFVVAVTRALDADTDWSPHYSAHNATWECRVAEFMRELTAVLNQRTE